jgi:hypothetical protein
MRCLPRKCEGKWKRSGYNLAFGGWRVRRAFAGIGARAPTAGWSMGDCPDRLSWAAGACQFFASETLGPSVNAIRMKVRLAGVEVGFVRAVRAQPANRTCPGEVEMEIRTSYELTIPNDSVASIATAGLLGETYLEIDVSQAFGPPVRTGSATQQGEREVYGSECGSGAEGARVAETALG